MASRRRSILKKKKKKGSKSKEAVGTLVSALKKQAKFRQLVEYSLDTLVKKISPTNSDWADNAAELVRAGGLEGLTDIMKRYSGNEKLLVYCTNFLAAVPKHHKHGRKFTKRLVSAGALKEVLISMKANPKLSKDGVKYACSLLTSCAQRNAKSLADEEHVASILGVLEVFKGNKQVVKACNRALELICKSGQGREAFMKCNGHTAMLGGLFSPASTDASTLSALRCLNRVCMQKQYVGAVVKAGAMKLLVKVLDTREASDPIAVVGSRLLNRIAGENLEQLLRDLRSGSLGDDMNEYTMQLISNLALDRKNALAVLKFGGIKACLDALDASKSARMVIAAARALNRIAVNDAVIAEIVAAGGLEKLCSMLKAFPDNPDVYGAVTAAITKLLNCEEHLARLGKCNGQKLVMQGALKHVQHEQSAVPGMEFLAKVIHLNYDVKSLISLGAMDAALAALKNHKGVVAVVPPTMRALRAIAETGNAQCKQVAQGSIESIMFNLITYKKRPEIVKSCMELLYTLSECRDNVKPIRAANGVEAVVAALYVNKDNEEIQRIGGKVLKNIVSADAVREAVRQLRFHTQNLRNDASKNNESIPGCEKALMALSAFAQSSTQLIGEEGGIDAIVKCLKVTLNSNALKKSQQQSLLNGVFRTINAMFLYGDSEQLFNDLVAVEGVDAIINFVKTHPKLKQSVRHAVVALRALCSLKDYIDIMVSKGVVDGFVSALRLNDKHFGICSASTGGLLEVSGTEAGAIAIARKGGTRQLINTLYNISSLVDFEPACLTALKAIENVARRPIGCDTIRKQKGALAIIHCLRLKPQDQDIQRAGIAALTQLFNSEHVKDAIERFNKIVAKGIGSETDLGMVANNASLVGYIAQIGKHGKLVVELGGADSLVKALRDVAKMSESDARDECMDVIIDALGLLGSAVPAEAYADAVPIILHRLQHNGSKAALVCVERLAGDTKNVPAIIADNKEWSESKKGGKFTNSKTGEVTNMPHPTEPTLSTVLDLIEGADDDAEIAANSFNILSRLCDHQSGLVAVGNTKALEISIEWLQNNMEDAPPEATAACLRLMEKLCPLDGTVPQLQAQGCFDLVMDILTDTSAEVPDFLLEAGLNLMLTAAEQDPAIREELIKSGHIARLISLFKDKQRSGPANFAMMQLLKQMANEYSDDLKEEHVEELIMSMMALNQGNDDLMQFGADILSKLLSPGELLMLAIEAVNQLNGVVAKGNSSQRVLQKMEGKLKQLMSLMYVDGAVNKGTGAKLLDLASAVLGTMLKLDDQEAENMEAMAMQIIGKLATMGLGLEVVGAIPGIVKAASEIRKGHRGYTLTKTHTAGLNAIEHFLDSNDKKLLDAILQEGAVGRFSDALEKAYSSGDTEAAERVEAMYTKLLSKLCDCFKDFEAAGRDKLVLQAAGRLGQLGSKSMDGVVATLKKRKDGQGILGSMLKINMKEGLPDGWTSGVDPDSQETYYVAPDGESSWFLPVDAITAVDVTNSQELKKRIVETWAQDFGDGDIGPLMTMALFDTFNSTDDSDLLSKCMQAIKALQLKQPVDNQDVIKRLLGLMAGDDHDLGMQALDLLTLMADSGDPSAKALAFANGVEKIMQLIEANQDNLDLVRGGFNCLYALHESMGSQGLCDAGIGDDQYILLSDMVDKYQKKDKTMKEKGGKLVEDLAPMFKHLTTGKGRIESQLAAIDGIIGANRYTAFPSEDGGLYYVASDGDGKSLWDVPEEYRSMLDHFREQANEIRDYHGKGEKVDPDIIKRCIEALSQQAADAKLAEAIAETLNHLADNDENMRQIAANLGIEAIIKALRQHPGNEALLRIFLTLLEKFVHHDVFKTRIGKVGGCQVVVLALKTQCTPEKVKSASKLPAGWMKCKDKKGRTYFYNTDTKKTQWKEPTVKKSPWRKAVDAKGRTYYYNKKTKETKWEKPADFNPAANVVMTGHHKLVQRLLRMLSKLTFNSKKNTELSVNNNGIPVLNMCLESFPKIARIVEVVLVICSNWVFVNDPNKIKVRNHCGKSIISAINAHHSDLRVYKNAIRAIGNMSLVDENVLWLTKHHAVKAITRHMNQDANDDEAKETAIKVIGNFAKSSEDMSTAGEVTITATIFQEGGAHAILDTVKGNEDKSSLLLAAIEALNDICLETATAEKLLQDGLVQLVVDTMKRYDYDEEMVEPTVELISTLCYSTTAANEFVILDGLQVLLSAMDTHEQNEDVLINGQISLNAIAHNKSHREAIMDNDGVKMMLKLIRTHIHNKEYLVEVLTTLARMASSPKVCEHIAEHGMHTLMQLIDENKKDADMLDYAFKVLGFLAFRTEGVRKIVQHDGINAIISAIGTHAREQKLMVRAIKTLDFIAMAHPDFAAIVNAHGGAAIIRKIMKAYSHVPDIQESSKSALIFLDDPSAKAKA